MRKLKEEFNKFKVKLTNIPFDDVIGHNNGKRIYFTVENNDVIYKRLKEETDINQLPYLGPCIDYGMGDICLEECMYENESFFKFYIIDRGMKDDCAYFNSIEDAIAHLVEFYAENKLIMDPNLMRSIFYESLNIEKRFMAK